MLHFKRYPQVGELLLFYANRLQRRDITNVLQQGIASAIDAEALGLFVWAMADAMAIDEEKDKIVLGRTDNFDMLADVEYEITVAMEQSGFAAVWQKICDGG